MLITLMLYQAMKWWGWTKRKSPHTAQHGKDGQTHKQHYNFERRARGGGHHDKILYTHTSLLHLLLWILLVTLYWLLISYLVLDLTSYLLILTPHHFFTSHLIIAFSLYKQTKKLYLGLVRPNFTRILGKSNREMRKAGKKNRHTIWLW